MLNSEHIENSRLRSFKNNARLNDLDDNRRRRAESSVDLRKQLKRKHQDLTRLKLTTDNNEANEKIELDFKQITMTILSKHQRTDENNLNKVNGQLLLAVRSIRQMLCCDQSSSEAIDRVIGAQLVPSLVELLSCDQSPAVQFESSWALTNITAGSSWQTRHVVDSGAIPHLIRLLSSADLNVRLQSLWALANIAGDEQLELRDLLIEAGVCKLFLSLVVESFVVESSSLSSLTTSCCDIQVAFLQKIAWTLQNLCGPKKSSFSFSSLSSVQKIFQEDVVTTLRYLLASNDRQVLAHTCSALSCLTKSGGDGEINIDVAMMSRLVELLNLHFKNGHDDPAYMEITSPALRCIANLVARSSSDSLTRVVIESNVLASTFGVMLRHTGCCGADMKRDAIWTISSIIASGGTGSENIQSVINAELVSDLIKLVGVGGSSDLRVQRAAVWTVINYTFRASREQMWHLFRCGVVEALCDQLVAQDADLLKCVLVALINILTVARMCGELEQVRLCVEETGGLERIERIQIDNSNEVVFNLASRIVDGFFGCGDFDHDEANNMDVCN